MTDVSNISLNKEQANGVVEFPVFMQDYFGYGDLESSSVWLCLCASNGYKLHSAVAVHGEHGSDMIVYTMVLDKNHNSDVTDHERILTSSLKEVLKVVQDVFEKAQNSPLGMIIGHNAEYINNAHSVMEVNEKRINNAK